MKLNKLSKEELELMSYTDMTYQLLGENKKPMTTPEIFKKICDLLEYSDQDYQSKISDYYTSLTIDKRFVLLDDGKWDLRDHHAIELTLNDEEDEEDENFDEIEDEEKIEDLEEIESEIDDIDDEDTTDDLDINDDLEDLSIVKEDELVDDVE